MTLPTTSPPLARALAERNYDQLTPVQTAVLAPTALDRDLLVSAQTGSGKTVAYGLAMAKDILRGADRFARAAAPLALALREALPAPVVLIVTGRNIDETLWRRAVEKPHSFGA